jgi:hypothetical protein
MKHTKIQNTDLVTNDHDTFFEYINAVYMVQVTFISLILQKLLSPFPKVEKGLLDALSVVLFCLIYFGVFCFLFVYLTSLNLYSFSK